MALRRLTIGASVILALLPATAHAGGAPTTAQIVVYKSAVTNAPGQTRKREHELGFVARHRYQRVLEGFAARLTDSQIARLRADPAVAEVVPDRPVHADSEPLVAGGTPPVGVFRIGAAGNGSIRQASGVAVAVIDTGIDLTNPDLNVVAGTNCMGSGPPSDDNGHGTHVAGTIGARNNGLDAVGVAPGTQLYAVKVLGVGGQGTESSIICGLDWVAQNAQALGIRVVNMSLGGGGSRGDCVNDPERAAVCQVVNAGVTVVVAAGNDSDVINGSGGHVPASYPEVLTVTAMADTDGQPGGLGAACGNVSDDAVAAFSNYAGPDDEDHTIAAPGDCVVSTARGGGVTTLSGTSMATPHVAAAAALCIDEAGTPGPCAGLPPAGVVDTLRTVAAEGATAQNGFDGDPLHPSGVGYFGYLVHASLAPIAATGDPVALADTRATLAGTADAHGSEATWRFDLGPAAGVYDQATPVQTGVLAPGPAAVQGDATGLDPGTTYHYRVSVTVDGWTAHGADKTFTTTGTPPPPPPDTTIDSGPAAYSTTGYAELHFSELPAGSAASFECRLDGPAWSPCDSPLVVADVGEGQHTFSVRAVGTQGKRDPTPATFTWFVDRTPPVSKIAGAPSDPTSNVDATFGVASNESGSTFECRLDSAEWAKCGTVVRLGGLAPGRHRFETRATDVVGLTDPTPAFYEWTVLGTTVTSGAAPPEPAPAEDPGAAEQPVNPLAPQAPGPVIAPRARLATIGSARVDRKRTRLTIAVLCRGPGSCAGRLDVAASGGSLGRFQIRLAAGTKRVFRLTVSRTAAARLRSRVPTRASLSLISAPRTTLESRTIRLLTGR